MNRRPVRRAAQQVCHGLALAVVLCGCDDAGKKPVQAHVPGQGIARTQVKPLETPTVQVGDLPVPNLLGPSFISLLQPAPDGIEYLLARVKQKFAEGEANYKEGHLEAARRNFDDAVDWMLESGYDPNGDPRLSELFHHVTDTVYSYELQAFRAGDGFTEAPAVPAPIDEVAEMTFPVDPKLKERAEVVSKSISHDLPLTVNDAGGFLSEFFPDAARARHCGDRSAAQGEVPRDDFAGTA